MFGRTWWGLALRGLLAVLLGIALLVWTGAGAIALVALIGAYFFVDGVLALISAFRVRAGHSRWWALLLEGIIGIAVGLITFFWPDVTAVALVYFIAAWAVITGILEIISAIRFSEEMENEWLLALAGLASIVLGVLLAINPVAGLAALVWVIGIYAIVFGVLLIIAGLRARGYADDDGRLRTA